MAKVLFCWSHLYSYVKVILVFSVAIKTWSRGGKRETNDALLNQNTREQKSEIDRYTKVWGKRRKRCKTRIQNCQQERKGSPRASAGRAVGASGEELPEDLPGKKHLRVDDTI